MTAAPRRHAARRRAAGGPFAWLRAEPVFIVGQHAADAAGAWLIYQVVTAVIGWAFVNAMWRAPDGSVCTRGGCGRLLAVHRRPSSASSCTGAIPMRSAGASISPMCWRLPGLVPLMIPRVPGKLWSSHLPARACFRCLRNAAVGRRVWAARRADRPVGRAAGDAGHLQRRHRGSVSDRHPAGAGTALAHADRALAVGRLHRVRARRAADHRAVHGVGDAAAVPARAMLRSTSCCGR